MRERSNTIPGEPGVWVFVLGDMAIFALFFGVFAYYRGLDVETFRSAQLALNQNFSAFNTLLLLLSSWLVVLALGDVRERAGEWAPRLFAGALACGMGFAVVKGVEYGELLHGGIGITTNDFFMYYFIFTGIHLVHVVIGMGVLLYLVSLTRAPDAAEHLVWIESGCVYWHMVDLLWIVLFPLLYLLR